ncbi:MAG TPA: IclR family transcriptional regulator [Stenotrophomonas sp.]
MLSPQATSLKEQNRYMVPALEKGLNMLLLFGQNRGELSFTQVCQRTGLPKASVYRTVQTLEQMRFLTRNTASGGYSLGISVLRLGFDYLSSMDIVQIGQPVIQRLRDTSSYSAHLCVLDGRDIVYVARACAIGEVGSGVGVGTRLPAHCTAIGRVLLMSLPQQEVNMLFPEPCFASAAEQGPKTPQELIDLLGSDSARGHAISESHYQPGVSSIAYPLRDREGNVLASISVMVPRSVLPPDLRLSLSMQVKKAALEIEGFLHAS